MMSNGIGIAIEPGAGLPVGSWIQHQILTMVWDVGGRKHPRFRVAASIHKPTTENVADYARRVIGDHMLGPLPGPTPWDIEVPNYEPANPKNHPRILVLQLDSAFMWEFSPATPGVDAKDDIPGYDSGLHYVDANGVSAPATPAGPPAGCRMIYWSVLSRPAQASGRAFNFYITLIDPESGRRMPTIFDPNVPDNGTGSIP